MTTVRHKKRGTLYEIIGYATMQSDTWLTEARIISPNAGGVLERSYADNHEVVIYRSLDDGKWWVWPRPEFEDGRFEQVSN